MKNFKYFLLPLVVVLSSCYIYKPYTEKEILETNSTTNQKGTSVRSQGNISANSTQVSAAPMNKSIKEQTLSEEDKIKIQQDEENRQKSPAANNNTSGKVGAPTPANSPAGQMTLHRDPNPVNQGKPDRSEVEAPKAPAGGGLKAKIQPNKYYKISVEEKEYKIQADKWEGDTLVSHILRKPNRVLRFHENQIDEELLKERRFSKAYSDLFTVGAYAAGGAAILLLIL
jgi:hypothetical protein